jgi:hypothetical protein
VNIFKEVKELNLPIGEYIVVGSGPMAARGIRECKDIDILVSEKLYNKLVAEDWRIVEIAGVTRKLMVLKKGLFEINKDLKFGKYNPETQNLINNAEIINGIPFLSLPELIKFKTALGRQKDFDDIKLIEKYLKNN